MLFLDARSPPQEVKRVEKSWSESGCDVRETDLPTVKRVPESFDCDLYHHEHQCQHHTSEGRCLVQRNTKTKYGGMDLKIPDGWKQMLTKTILNFIDMFGINDIENGDLVDLKRLELVS